MAGQREFLAKAMACVIDVSLSGDLASRTLCQCSIDVSLSGDLPLGPYANAPAERRIHLKCSSVVDLYCELWQSFWTFRRLLLNEIRSCQAKVTIP